jgi:hypothetical protein
MICEGFLIYETMENEFVENYQGYDIYKDPNGYFFAEMQLSPISKDIEVLRNKIDEIEKQIFNTKL